MLEDDFACILDLDRRRSYAHLYDLAEFILGDKKNSKCFNKRKRF
jgi:hypothetical protein